jgi:hypothetical protein
VRAVATEVGLDADELTREYCARFEIEEATGPLPPNRLPFAVVTIGILIGGAAILLRGQIPGEAPDERLPLLAVEADLPKGPALTYERDATEEVAFANAAVGETAAQSLRLEIEVDGPCWVSAVADGERVVYRLMQPGERTLVEARRLITLRVGDAGVVAYSINGATGRQLGRNGEAVTVRIVNENVASLFAEPRSAIPAKGAATRSPSGLVGRDVETNGQRAVTA